MEASAVVSVHQCPRSFARRHVVRMTALQYIVHAVSPRCAPITTVVYNSLLTKSCNTHYMQDINGLIDVSTSPSLTSTGHE